MYLCDCIPARTCFSVVLHTCYTFVMYADVSLLDSSTADCSLSSLFSYSSSPPDIPEFDTWIGDLCLSQADRQILVDGGWLTANHMSAASKLLKAAFPGQSGLQDTCRLYYKYQWNSVPQGFV